MNNISLKNQAINFSALDKNKIVEQQENFTALNGEKLKKDSVEIKKNAQEQVKENWIFKTLRNVFGIKDPKKALTSLGLTLATVVGLAFIGNKSSDKMAELGLQLDRTLKDTNKPIGNFYQKIAGGLANIKNAITTRLRKIKLFDNIAETLKDPVRKAKPKSDFTRGYGRGFSSIFALTPVDILRKKFNGKSVAEVTEALKKLVGKDKAKEFAEQLLGQNGKGIKVNSEFCDAFSQAIRKHLGAGKSNEEFLEILKQLKTGKIGSMDVSEFIGVDMKDGGQGRISKAINWIGRKIRGDKWKDVDKVSLIGDWWPTRMIEKVGRIFKKDFTFCRGNLGDSLIKYNVVKGNMADTKLARLFQKSITVPTESISNFVNDKSGMGAFLCASIMSLYNNTQDAPKGKKLPTIADDFIGTIGSIAISTPLAFKTTYALASLANIKDTGTLSRIVKKIGSVFNMGLKEGDSTIKRFGGGALRFYLIMMVFSGLFAKPIRAGIHKIFGKPYDKAEEAKKQQLEEQRKLYEQQKNTVIPGLTITYADLEQKINNNPQAILNLQNDPLLAQQVMANPKLLVDYLDGKEIKSKPKDVLYSPINQQLVGRRNLFGASTKSQPAQAQAAQQKVEEPHSVDTATYVPSSQFIANDSNLSQEQRSEYANIMSKTDALIRQAEKYM